MTALKISLVIDAFKVVFLPAAKEYLITIFKILPVIRVAS